MREHPTYDSDAIFNPETHHEKSDVSVRALLWFILIVVVFSFLLHIVIYLMYKGFAGIERRRNTVKMTEMERPADLSVPKNQPLLQPFPRKMANGEDLPPNSATPVVDLAEMRRTEDQALHSYGWVDKQKGIVRIPIEEAMKLAVQRLQSAAPAPPPAKPATPESGARP